MLKFFQNVPIVRITIKVARRHAMEVQNISSNNYAETGRSINSDKPKADPIKAYQKEAEMDAKISRQMSEKEMERLIADLNDQIGMISTDLRFGFNNKAEMLEVSVINKKTDQIIRRFPTEEAVTLMTSMKEFIGLLFDKKG